MDDINRLFICQRVDLGSDAVERARVVHRPIERRIEPVQRAERLCLPHLFVGRLRPESGKDHGDIDR